MKLSEQNGLPVETGNNIEIDFTTDRTIISAVNTTTLKNGPFTISGESIEIIAGRGIQINTKMPNIITISVDDTKEFFRVKELEKANSELSKRLENIEKAILNLTRKGVISANN